jgi:hypothetical protein
VGTALKLNPLPTATTGLNGVPLSTLPSWVVPQAGATTRYLKATPRRRSCPRRMGRWAPRTSSPPSRR